MPPMMQHGQTQPQRVAERRTIPFDYTFRYLLTGVPGTVQNSTVTVSIEATFMAVSIGFGVIPDTTGVSFTPQLAVAAVPRSLLQVMPFLGSLASAFGEVIPASGNLPVKTALALKNGIRINPTFARAVLNQGVNTALKLSDVLQVVSPTREDVQFTYAIFDEGTGREFQNEPILSTAGLGSSTGERPFRHFARPIEFRPRSTIRMQITEVSDFVGDLHISLQGYKVLGEAGTPTGRIGRRAARGRSH